MINEKYGSAPFGTRFTAMLGAACGDITGSVYEWHNIKHKIRIHEMINESAEFTDDTVMTCAVADGIMRSLSVLPENAVFTPEGEKALADAIVESMQRYGRKYPEAGYGGTFGQWIYSDAPQPYGSWGNGSAMRVSFAGWAAKSLDEAEKLAEISAKVTHSHPDGIKGAKVVAGMIYLLRSGADKEEALRYADKYYNMAFTLNDIRDYYIFDVSCAGSVPPAIRAFYEGKDFADVISLALSIGGDSDTIAAIAGSIAEVIYPMPNSLYERTVEKLDSFLLGTLMRAVRFLLD